MDSIDGLARCSSVAGDGRDGYGCLAYWLPAKDSPDDRFLVLLVEQCALDHLGLAHAGLGNGDTPDNPCRHEYQRRQQE
jgi:hypothetical protein